ncbi:MAG: hotdog fold thioesterase [Saprospiraceae bacterium]
MIWKEKPELDVIQQINKNTLAEHLGIEVIEIGDDYIRSRMPVDHRTRQPVGLLHGGASVVLSESIGSIASFLISGDAKTNIVGIEVNANHLKSVSEGHVYGITRPVKLGRTLHIWNTEVTDKQGQLICVSRLTVMIISR